MAQTPKDPLAEDFRNFVFAIWKHLGLPKPTEVQYDIAQFLQNGPRRMVIEAFRGVGKSWITAAFTLWILYQDADKKVLVVSANATKATEFTTFVLQLVNDVPFLQHLQPRHDQRQSMLSFDVGPAKPDQSPSVKSIGITGQITGGRADVIVADDVEVPHNSDTPGKREKLLELVKEFDAVLKPGGRIVYLGTPQTEQTIYAVLESRGYIIRVWPARLPKDLDKYAGKLAPIISRKVSEKGAKPGEPTDPERFHEEDLTERELSYGRSGFALQFMLDTQLSDAEKHPLKLADLICYPLDPYRAPIDLVWASSPTLQIRELPMVGLQGDRMYAPAWTSADFAPYEASVMFVDPAGRGRDETAYAVVKLLHGRLFLSACGGILGTGYEEENLKKLLDIAKAQGANRILTEPNFGGGMFTKLLQGAAERYYGVTVLDADWRSTQKESRIIDTLEPVLNQHRLVVCPSVIQHDYDSVLSYGDRGPLYRLGYQLTRITRERGSLAHDDRLDALAGAVAHWTKHLAIDTEQAAIRHKETQLDAELEKFVAHAMGSKGGVPGGRRMASRVSRNILGTK